MKAKRTALVVLGVLTAHLALAGPAAAQTGRQTFVLTELRSGGGITVTAAGPIRGRGVVIPGGDELDEETGEIVANDRYQFTETDGVDVTYRVRLTSAPTIDTRTCVGRHGGTMTWEITGGTGRYADASGSGTGTFRVIDVAGRNPDGSCSESQADDRAHVLVVHLTGTGTVPAQRAA